MHVDVSHIDVSGAIPSSRGLPSASSSPDAAQLLQEAIETLARYRTFLVDFITQTAGRKRMDNVMKFNEIL